MDSDLRTAFQTHGYVTVRDALSTQQTAYYVEQLEQLSGVRRADSSSAAVHWNVKDGVSRTPAFWPLLFQPQLLSAIAGVLGSRRIVYTEQSDLKVWRHRAASGWHRDSVDEQFGVGTDWSDTYRVVRVALYLQPVDDGFFWGAIPGSHRREVELRPWEREAWRQLLQPPKLAIPSRLAYLEAADGRLWISTAARNDRVCRPTEPAWIRTHPTDAVLFDPRLIHAGGPVGRSKYAIFFSFGVNNEHSRRHAAHFTGAPSRPPALQEQLRAAGLALSACAHR